MTARALRTLSCVALFVVVLVVLSTCGGQASGRSDDSLERADTQAAPALVKGKFSEVNIGTFDLVDGIAWAIDGGTVVYAVSKPIASSTLVSAACPVTMA